MAKKRQYPSQPDHLTALKLPLPPRSALAPDLQKYFGICDEKIGFLPNVLAAYSFDESKLRAFIGLYNNLMLDDSALSKLEREMIAVVVSAQNHCYYCLVAHGQAVPRSATLGAEKLSHSASAWYIGSITPPCSSQTGGTWRAKSSTWRSGNRPSPGGSG